MKPIRIMVVISVCPIRESALKITLRALPRVKRVSTRRNRLKDNHFPNLRIEVLHGDDFAVFVQTDRRTAFDLAVSPKRLQFAERIGNFRLHFGRERFDALAAELLENRLTDFHFSDFAVMVAPPACYANLHFRSPFVLVSPIAARLSRALLRSP